MNWQMRIFKSGRFDRFARKERIEDAILCEAVRRAEQGLVDAELGNGLIKQRVARRGAGKSGGFRTIVIFRTEIRAVFVFGFAKSDRSNLDDMELTAFRKAAKLVLSFSDAQMDAEIAAGRMIEMNCNG